ncbi:uncharacterized protein M6B38_277760 [Iris pallida]|uniref:WRKY19-like zinc finger domain-containing protein n=1 Tax=Iris pallida TaxID=29817 RepID=A0AAX6EKF4_IRIPA|nr:uncharacterized protein M6B38_182490 [Iris pallida]KAJ6847381.1 uncharacterized protein M6B38_277760 [Iris pallida]
MDRNITHLLFHGNGTSVNSSINGTDYIMICDKNDSSGDTTLRLDCQGFEANNTLGMIFPQGSCDPFSAQDDGCKLVLGLGPTPTSYCADFPSGLTKSKESVSMPSGADSSMLQLVLGTPIVDESSTLSKRMSGGYMPSLLFAPRAEESVSQPGTHDLLDLGSDISVHHHKHQFSPEPSATTDCSIGGASDQHQVNHHHPKKCRFKGCTKGARGASGLCIAHGGGQRCQKPGCNKGAESRTAYCKAHGGGRRCHLLGCTKSAEGRTDFCIAHGGGRRCNHLGCTKAARGKSGLCIRHGGGKRCSVEGCTRSAEGQAGLCISHGGGRRCQFPGCNKGAQGGTMHCKAHGGGKRCVFEGCTKGAEGSTPLCKGHGGGKRCLFEGGGVCPKSVHGGTNYCVAHGGGKRCVVPGCTKSARGRTDCCVRHGGGKRCKSEGCGKSAQGSTDYCKAHGGGKRCSWGGCEKFARGRSGLCAAHASMTTVSKEGSEGMIGSGLFRGIVSSTSVAVTTTTTAGSSDRASSDLSAVSDCAQSADIAGRRKLFIPQVLVPTEMKADVQEKGYGFAIPEGRVHGGGLMSLLGGTMKNFIDNPII